MIPRYSLWYEDVINRVKEIEEIVSKSILGAQLLYQLLESNSAHIFRTVVSTIITNNRQSIIMSSIESELARNNKSLCPSYSNVITDFVQCCKYNHTLLVSKILVIKTGLDINIVSALDYVHISQIICTHINCDIWVADLSLVLTLEILKSNFATECYHQTSLSVLAIDVQINIMSKDELAVCLRRLQKRKYVRIMLAIAYQIYKLHEKVEKKTYFPNINVFSNWILDEVLGKIYKVETLEDFKEWLRHPLVEVFVLSSSL